MSDQPYSDQMVPLYFEDQVVIIIRGELALAAAEKIAAILSEAMSRPARSGGGNWGGKKEGADLGLYRVPPTPAALAAMKAGDTFKVPCAGYYFKTGQYPKLVFFSPFDAQGQLTDGKVGVQAATIQPSSKTWEKLFVVNGKAWEYDPSGQAHVFNLRIATLCVGQDKEDPAKKFVFLVAIKPSEIADPAALTYVDDQEGQANAPQGV